VAQTIKPNVNRTGFWLGFEWLLKNSAAWQFRFLDLRKTSSLWGPKMVHDEPPGWRSILPGSAGIISANTSAAMSDPLVAPFIVPEFDGTRSIRDWHIQFATQNVGSLSRLQAMTPGRVVLVTIDPSNPKPKVSFRTDQNVIALLPPEEAESVHPEKIVVVSYDREGVVVATRFRINGHDPAAI
jgi:hypothetical protein